MKQEMAVILRSAITSFLVVIAVGLNVGRTDQNSEPTKDKLDSSGRLETLLKAWDKANQNAREIHYIMEWTTEDRVLKDKNVRRAEGFVKKHKLARLDLSEDKGKPTQIILLNDRTLEMYNIQKKEKLSWETPFASPGDDSNKGWFGGILARMFQEFHELFCFDISLDEVHQRFDVHLRKEDQYWAYIQLIPKTKEEREFLRELEVVLDQKTHLIRQYRGINANGNRSILDFQKVEINPTPAITLESISKDLPKGFKETNLQNLIGEQTEVSPADSKSR